VAVQNGQDPQRGYFHEEVKGSIVVIKKGALKKKFVRGCYVDTRGGKERRCKKTAPNLPSPPFIKFSAVEK